MKTAIIKGLAFFHVAVIIIAVTHLSDHFPEHRVFYPVRLAYTYYYKMTLHNQKFAFFGPRIEKQLTAEIFCTNTAGKRFKFSFPVPNSELELRRKKTTRHFIYEQRRTAVIDNWKHYIKSLHPDVRKIEILIFENDLPTMSQYRKGSKRTKTLYYKTTIPV